MKFLTINLWDDEQLRVYSWAEGTSKRLERVVAHRYRTSGVDSIGRFFSTYKEPSFRRRSGFIHWQGSELGVLEDAIKLDVLPKARYKEIRAEYEKKKDAELMQHAAEEILRFAPNSPIQLSNSQIAKLSKAAGI